MKMIKSLFLIVVFIACSFVSFSQRDSDDANESFFKKENVFTGGTLNLAFGNQQTSLGLSPFLGYSINKYLDVAAVLSFNYTSLRDDFGKYRYKIFGPGAFIRVFPFNFIFAQAQYELNFQRNKYIQNNGVVSPFDIQNLKSDNFLVGGGISNGKDFPSQKSYYYFSILWDVSNSKFPYKDNLNRSVPIIRAGYNIALFQGGR